MNHLENFLFGIRSAFTIFPNRSYSVPTRTGFGTDLSSLRSDHAHIVTAVRANIKHVKTSRNAR